MRVPIARLVIRDSGPADTTGLFVGALFKNQKRLKPGRVYEIVEIMGEITIREVGPSIVGTTIKNSLVPATWSHAIGTILDTVGKYLLLSRAEYRRACAADNPKIPKSNASRRRPKS